VRLVDERAEVTGGATGRRPLLENWREADLAREWRRTVTPAGVAFDSPPLTGLTGEPGTLEVLLEPAGATSLKLILLVPQHEVREIVALRHRQIDLPLPKERDGLVRIRASIREVLEGNWLDAGAAGRLQAIRIVLPGADEKARLVSVSLHDSLAAFEGAAGVRELEAEGEFRRGWYVTPGARVRVRVRVPAAGAELRWAVAAAGGPVQAAIRLEVGDDKVALFSAAAGPRWSAHRRSLERWAGKEVTLELSAAAPDAGGSRKAGVALFGEPRIVAGPVSKAVPDVLVYLIDTLRVDRIGAWGAQDARTPVIDRLAREGVQFRHAQSSTSWTKPAIPTLMSGILPPVHRVGARSYTDRLPRSVPLVQERFRDAGWRTGSFAANPLGSTLSGLERGFDAAYAPRYWRGRVQLGIQPAASQLHAALLDWIGQEPDRPFFAYVHTLEVHEYTLPRYRPNDGGPAAAYDRAVADADVQLGALLSALAPRMKERPLLLVLLSDHGESLGEHGVFSHGQSVYQSELAIPLLFWANRGLPKRTIDEPVGLADLPVTLLDLFGLPPLAEAEGESLLSWIEGERPRRRAAVPSSLIHFFMANQVPERYALLWPDLKKVVVGLDSGPVAFDLAADPGERHPLAAATAATLARRLERWLRDERRRRERYRSRHPERTVRPLDSEAIERLRSLGYVD